MLDRYQDVKINMFSGCDNFMRKRQKFVFYTFTYFEPVERSENRRHARGF